MYMSGRLPVERWGVNLQWRARIYCILRKGGIWCCTTSIGKKNTLGWYIKEAVTLKLLTEHEENQTISIYFPQSSSFPPFMGTDRKHSRWTAHGKTDESCFNKGSMVIKCQIRPFRTAKTVPGKYPDQLKINQVRQNNKNPNWLV